MHLRTLELPKIQERLATYAAFSASKELVLNLKPTPFYPEALTRQTETSEAVHLLTVKDEITIGAARDVRPLVARSIREIILTPHELNEVSRTLVAARSIQRVVSRLAESYPRLADIVQRIEECPGVIHQINQAIDESNEVKSNASPKLAQIRRDIDIVHNRLLEQLNKMARSPQYAHYLQDALVTQRGGRYVLPVKAGFKGKIRGVVHDQSSSGQTVFIEPLVTVEQNNRWQQLLIEERDEIRRILAELSGLVAQHAREIDHTVEALAEFDLALAKAKYATALEAVAPQLVDLRRPKLAYSNNAKKDKTDDPDDPEQPLAASGLKLIRARHPLLEAETVVPLDMPMPEETSILVITGPNTGGKTVALKTVGLLAMMAQAGLWIPADEGSSLPVFNKIMADIGDEQSIEQNLSTFSGHMTNVVSILHRCNARSLVIFDELGAGTDPIEGSALARAILSQLLRRRVTTLVATHYSELKAYAHSTDGIVNANMEFDMDTLAPTYRLLVGLPGASNAFTIAHRLGLSRRIINEARGLVGEDVQKVEAMLAQIKSEREMAHTLRVDADKAKTEYEQKLATAEQERAEILQSARADAREEVEQARQKIRTLQAQVEQTQAELETTLELVREQQAAPPEIADILPEPASAKIVELDQQLAELTSALTERDQASQAKQATQSQAPQRRKIKVGDIVFISTFKTEGEVMAISGQSVDVQMGSFRTTVPRKQVEFRRAKAEVAPQPTRTVRETLIESPGMELDLRGQLPEEATYSLDKYLDQAFMAQLPWVRIIHGRGSGVLRRAVRDALKQHALVSTHQPGKDNEGGEGVTIAKLAIR